MLGDLGEGLRKWGLALDRLLSRSWDASMIVCFNLTYSESRLEQGYSSNWERSRHHSCELGEWDV